MQAPSMKNKGLTGEISHKQRCKTAFVKARNISKKELENLKPT